jgi:hypothetical protein
MIGQKPGDHLLRCHAPDVLVLEHAMLPHDAVQLGEDGVEELEVGRRRPLRGSIAAGGTVVALCDHLGENFS